MRNLARIFHELLSRDHETGNPLVVDTACGAGLSGAQRSRIRWACHLEPQVIHETFGLDLMASSYEVKFRVCKANFR